VKPVRRPESAVKGVAWPARLLDGLRALGGWLAGPDPGLNRLRIVLCATLTIAVAIGAEWLFVHFTGALQRAAPPAAAGAAAAARVMTANHAVLIFGMVLGGVIGLQAAVSVQDTSPRDQVVSMATLPLPMIAALALALAAGGHRVLALCLVPPILAAGTYLRRFGPPGVRIAPLLFIGYLFGFLLRSVITVGDTGWLAAEIGVGILVAIVIKAGVFHDTSGRALRRTQRSYAARARRLAGLALAAFDEPGPWSSRRLHRQKTRLGQAARLIDGQLADPGTAPADSAAALLHQRLIDARLALANLVRFAEALGRSPLRAGQREQVREILVSLRDGQYDNARASAVAFAQTLTAPAGPGSLGGDHTEIIAHRFAGSVTDFTDALSQWLRLGAQDDSAGGDALFAPAVPLRQGGSLSVTAAATAARHYALNLIRDIPPAAAPDQDTAALLDRGCHTLEASLTALQSAVADPHGTTYTRSASVFDLVEQRIAPPGNNGTKALFALRDLKLIDGALAELAAALGMDVTSYDTGPAGDLVPSAAPPDASPALASSESAAAEGGEPDR
jgi:hypothetical protein